MPVSKPCVPQYAQHVTTESISNLTDLARRSSEKHTVRQQMRRTRPRYRLHKYAKFDRIGLIVEARKTIRARRRRHGTVLWTAIELNPWTLPRPLTNANFGPVDTNLPSCCALGARLSHRSRAANSRVFAFRTATRE